MRACIFGRHDLVHAAPISHIDLLVLPQHAHVSELRTQARVLARLHFAVEDGGILFLGKAEMLLSHGNLFAPIDLKRRIFAKFPRVCGSGYRSSNDGGGYEPLSTR